MTISTVSANGLSLVPITGRLTGSNCVNICNNALGRRPGPLITFQFPVQRRFLKDLDLFFLVRSVIVSDSRKN